MDNNQRIEFLLKLERRDKRRKIIIGLIIVLLIGAGLIFAQIKNFATL